MRPSQKTPETITTIGIDLGKNRFHLVGLDKRGAIVLQQKVSRAQLERRLANIPRCLIAMKNRILLENYYLPGELELNIGEFVTYYNNRRYHERLDNLTPADVYFGRGPTILKRRESIKRKTIQQRRRLHQQAIAA